MSRSTAERQTVGKLGRPRDESVEPAVAKAVFELLEEVGPGALSMDAIASRAGVSKATIYRRWDSKEELVIDCVANLVSADRLPDIEDIRSLLIVLLRRLNEFMTEAEEGSIFPWLVGEVSAGTELGRQYAEAVILPRRRMLAGLLTDAVERGELRADLDVELAMDMVTGPVILGKVLSPFREPDPGWEEKLVDLLLTGWQTV